MEFSNSDRLELLLSITPFEDHEKIVAFYAKPVTVEDRIKAAKRIIRKTKLIVSDESLDYNFRCKYVPVVKSLKSMIEVLNKYPRFMLAVNNAKSFEDFNIIFDKIKGIPKEHQAALEYEALRLQGHYAWANGYF